MDLNGTTLFGWTEQSPREDARSRPRREPDDRVTASTVEGRYRTSDVVVVGRARGAAHGVAITNSA